MDPFIIKESFFVFSYGLRFKSILSDMSIAVPAFPFFYLPSVFLYLDICFL